MKRRGVWDSVPDIHSTVVPLWHSHEDGDEVDGFLDVPANLCGTYHDNAAHKRHAFIEEQMGRWIEWKAKQGWYVSGLPKVSGPYDIPRETPDAPENTEKKRYMVRARFKRRSPMAISLDDYLAVRDMADNYGVDLSKPKLTANVLPTPVKGMLE